MVHHTSWHVPCIDGDDYEGQDLILTFSEGDTGSDINITILGDTVVEPTEVFFAELQTADPDVRLDSPTTLVQITDSGGKCAWQSIVSLVPSLGTRLVFNILMQFKYYSFLQLYFFHSVILSTHSVRMPSQE